MTLSKKQAQNRAQILDAIYSHNRISRIDIAKLTAITPATTSAITNELLQEGFIQEVGEEQSNKVGRKKIHLQIKEGAAYFLGSELSEKYFSFIIADNLGLIKEHTIYKLSTEQIAYQGFEIFKGKLIELLNRYKDYQIKAIAIALPGHYDQNKDIVTNNSLWQCFNLSEIKKLVSLPVYFANNVEGMALKKRLFDVEKKNDNYLYFHIGRGIKCSYIYESQVFSKQNMLIGEVGHVVVDKDGSLCECGKKGCLQTFISENWLIKRAQILYNNDQESYLKRLLSTNQDIQVQTLLTAFELGDKSIQILLEQAIQALSQVILNLNLIIDFQSLYIHSELFNHPAMQQILLSKLAIEPNLLLNLPKSPTVIFEPYTPLDGAVGAVATAVQKCYLL
ncbi:ROK family transcriptional regulator [Enterococcus cecorum]|uniref:ROK family transcriptional regulator n=1 Tax=Enterococcus cecorum TaxID=44008 RepID=UPI000A7D8C28|nr:ROK family transcriptional regulator [Enterococcus cecorum]MDZ5499900.1 ROK family transcriptional regulator [Enterococcus cecorum]MDZ5563381.1 ROK family transcriptional regulator [Enterococcus cecorum]CAI3406170.1 ROK family transcriptional regulator [Enterococcus cecorum]